MMKKILNKIYFSIIVITLFSTVLKAQLPLHQGSIVITHKPDYGMCSNNNSTTPGSVVQILDASNTSNIPVNAASPIPNKYVWTKNSPPQSNPKPNWYSNTQASNAWNVNNLGRVFGLTLDRAGNIYVANTSIYTGEDLTYHDEVFKINGSTGAITLVYNFATSNNSPALGIGNIKIFRINSINYMAVTVWEDGKIHILKEPTSGTGTWTHIDAYDPSFNNTGTSLPYGVAVRPKTGTTNYEIFYGEYANNNSGPNIKIYKVEINNNGSFITGTESQITTIGMPIRSSNFTQGTGGGFGNLSSVNSPIPVSDISFSSNYKRMVVAQQQLATSQDYQAHNAKVQEFSEVSTGTWSAIGKYPVGNLMLFGSPSNTSGFNSVGGVSYWNNILFKNSYAGNHLEYDSLQCDTTILFSSDVIYYTTVSNQPSITTIECLNNFGSSCPNPVAVYGFQALPSNNNFTSDIDAFNYSLKVDADDDFNHCDKQELGDIEAFNIPLECSAPQAPACICGQFDSLVLMNNSGTTNYANNWPNLSFTGTASGVLFAYYHCNTSNGIPCAATYSWQVTSNGNPVNLSFPLTNNSFDLAWLNTLPCNKTYTITVIAKCGTKTCEPKSFTITLNCIPPSSVCPCAGNVEITQSAVIVTQNNTSNVNPVSLATTSFTLTATAPVTEVRMLIDEFRLTTTAGNDNCTLCKNKPQTWANINSATLTGIANQPLANTTALQKDLRELIFNNGGSSFNLNGNTLNLSLGLPGVTGLNCCTLKAEVCVKFIIRDANCCEREIMKCFTFNLQ